jgi:hypothetical protein
MQENQTKNSGIPFLQIFETENKRRHLTHASSPSSREHRV